MQSTNRERVDAEETAEITYDLAEVEKHCVRGDAWVVVGGNVYDVSEFAERHPGGEDLLLGHAGEDVSVLLQGESPHQHSQAAFTILENHRLGRLREHAEQSQVTGNGHGRLHSNGVESLTSAQLRKPLTGVVNGRAKNGAHQAPCEMTGWREENLVDWSKPMLCQVGRLGPLYHKWVHSPVDRPLRLFHSDVIEFFSKTPWFVIPIVWLPLMVFLSVLCVQGLTRRSVFFPMFSPAGPLSVPYFLCWFLSGIVTWSLVEYLLHRFLFHLTPPDSSPFLITFHFMLHGQHHKVPFESSRLVFPPPAAAVLFSIFYYFFTLFIPIACGRAMMAGGVLGYVCYDLIHYYLHHGEPPQGSYFHRLKTIHVQHHFIDHQSGFGISSKVWDIPFGTHGRRWHE